MRWGFADPSLRLFQDHGMGRVEGIQAELFNYIVAAIPYFDLPLCPTASSHVTVQIDAQNMPAKP